MDINQKPILHEIVLNLLVARKKIQLTNTINNNKSLTEAVQKKELLLGKYESLLKNLFDPSLSLSSDTYDILRNIKDLNIPYIEGEDLLGLLYMSLSSSSSRKNKGSYYTPKDVVDLLVNQSLDELGEMAFPRVLDPCCGSGNFLIRLFVVLNQRLLDKGLNKKEVEKTLLTKCLHGYDIDSTAAILARLNLVLLTDTPYEELCNEPFQIHCENALNSYDTSSNKMFDLILGNPPWGFSFSHQDTVYLRKNFTSVNGQLESYWLFIEYGLNQLRPQGILAYVLPESVLNVHVHEPIRRLIISQTEILIYISFFKSICPIYSFKGAQVKTVHRFPSGDSL